MGIFDGFIKSIAEDRQNREIVEMYHDMQEQDPDYRAKAFDNTDSNHGWYTCPRCGRKFRADDMDADHIVPQSRGGSDSRYNLQLLCKHCNRSKGNDMDDTWDDLKRRERELRQQDRDDVKYLNELSRKNR